LQVYAGCYTKDKKIFFVHFGTQQQFIFKDKLFFFNVKSFICF
jgi:hypothetical protein